MMNHSRPTGITRLAAAILVITSLFSILSVSALAEAAPAEEPGEQTSLLEETLPPVEGSDAEPAPEESGDPVPESEPAGESESAEEPASESEPEPEPEAEAAEEPESTAEPEPADEPTLDSSSEGAYSFPTDANGNRYYIDPDTGKRRTGWLKLEGLWYYFWSDGTLATGWCFCNDGYWYYFNKETGVVHRGWITTADGSRYYMRPENAREQTGWREIDGLWYYFGKNGKMMTGWVLANDGWWYYFDPETGAVHRGWITDGEGDTYYMRPEDAREQTGWRKIDGWWYNFGNDGRRREGWQYIGGYKYYFAKPGDGSGFEPGVNVSNVEIDGYWVNEQGYTTDSWSVWERMVRVAEFQKSQTEYLIIIDTTYCSLGVFQGSKGNWEGIYYWLCSPGAYSTPTVRGDFTINSKGQYFYGANTGCRCWYWSEFHGGDYAIHSVLYTPNGKYISDGRLGMHLSHGCVRLDINNAYWIYANCPIGTKVLVY